MKRESLWFSAPRTVTVATEDCEPIVPEEVLIETAVSAISAGTELLVYRNTLPTGIALDETIATYQTEFRYPVKYGYAVVGRVVETGSRVDPSWKGRRVFAFHCHESRFAAQPDALLPVPDDLTDEDAVFLANMETAVTLALDGRPLIGEQVAVHGQGIVGLLTTAVLSRFPLARLQVYDCHRRRLEAARSLGADVAHEAGEEYLNDGKGRIDLAYELAGSEQALQLAIDQAAFSGRIVVGSWFGSRPATLHLGGGFHRKRLQLVSSQVSTLSPSLTGRWDKERRLETAWRCIRDIGPSKLITHRFPLREAQDAFACLDKTPEEVLQVVFHYAMPGRTGE